MRASNRHGTPIDPVPFVVVAGLACMLLLSFGPLYGQAFGLSLLTALAVSVALSVGAVTVAFYRQVWTATPLEEAPVEMRAERLFYGTLAFAVVVLALTLPLVI